MMAVVLVLAIGGLLIALGLLATAFGTDSRDGVADPRTGRAAW